MYHRFIIFTFVSWFAQLFLVCFRFPANCMLENLVFSFWHHRGRNHIDIYNSNNTLLKGHLESGGQLAFNELPLQIKHQDKF